MIIKFIVRVLVKIIQRSIYIERHIYIYIHIYRTPNIICMCIYIYIYIYSTPERKKRCFSWAVLSGNEVCFQWRNWIKNLTAGIRLCDVVFLLPLLHTTFRETDAQEMQKCYGFGKFCSALNPCGCNDFSFLVQKSSRVFSTYFSSS